jgi:hemolysin activation/secretion protein
LISFTSNLFRTSSQGSSRWVFISLIGVVLFSLPNAEAQRRPLDGSADLRRELLDEDRFRDEVGVSDAREDEPENFGDPTPLGVDLKALVVLPHQDAATLDASVGAEPILIDAEVPAPEGLRAALEPFLGRPLSLALLGELQRDVVLAWRDSEYPLVDVYFPEQNVTGGKVQLVVREAVMGVKKVEGAKVSREEYLLGQLGIEAGDRVNRSEVESDLDWLNENPIRQVNLIYQRGASDGTTDIQLDVHEKKQLSAYTSYGNTGVELTGEEEWAFGFYYANPFQTEQGFGYNYGTDQNWESLEAHSAFYQGFLPWQHTVRLIGAYVTSASEDPLAVGIDGLSRQLTGEYHIPLPRPRFNRLVRHALTFAFDYKSTNTDLIFGGVNVFSNEIAIGQFRGQYEFALPDPHGYSKFSAGFVGSPGDLYGNNTDVAFDQARVGSDAAYTYFFGEAERLQRLPHDFSLRLKLAGQATSDRLPTPEQFLTGGYTSVRGFDENAVRGDSGILATVELISPDFSVFGTHGVVGLPDTWNALLFVDSAALDLSSPVLGETSASLSSVGVGVNGRFGETGFVRASYGWRVSEDEVPIDGENGKFHFGVTLAY